MKRTKYGDMYSMNYDKIFQKAFKDDETSETQENNSEIVSSEKNWQSIFLKKLDPALISLEDAYNFLRENRRNNIEDQEIFDLAYDKTEHALVIVETLMGLE